MRRCQYVVQCPEGVRRRQGLNVEYVDRRAIRDTTNNQNRQPLRNGVFGNYDLRLAYFPTNSTSQALARTPTGLRFES